MITNICKKVLDKTLKRGYNIHMDKRVDIDTFINTLVNDYSFNVETSKKTIQKLVETGDRIKSVWGKHFPTKPLPVIAGGSVRDAVFGKEPNDFDIFFNCKDIGEAWKESTGMEDGAEILISTFVDDAFPTPEGCYQLGQHYEGIPGSLYVFESWNVGEDGLDLQPYQFVGTDLVEDTADYIKTFDYDLVKIGYDIGEGKFIVTEDFLNGLGKANFLPRYTKKTREQDFLALLNSFKVNIEKGNYSSRYSMPKKTLDISYEPVKSLSGKWITMTTGSTTAQQLKMDVNFDEWVENRGAALPVREVQQL